MRRALLEIVLFFHLLHRAFSITRPNNKTEELLDVFLHNVNDEYSGKGSCSSRLHSSLENLRKRQNPTRASSGFIDLSGYALHQTLRHAPLDMYVTDIKVRTAGVGNWVRVEKCQFSNRENQLVAQILFNDLAVTGNVKLFEENTLLKNPGQPVPSEFCSMTVRLRRAGLGINAFPARGRSRGIEVRTEARFVDPSYLSVHAYGCKVDRIVQDRERESKRLDRSLGSNEVRIITLLPNLPGADDSSLVQLHREDESDLNNYHKDRILGAIFQDERDKLNAVLHVKNLISQQANQVFQAHGPFSNFHSVAHKPLFEENIQGGPIFKPAGGVVSSITELDENLTPVRPIDQRPFFSPLSDQIITGGDHQNHVTHSQIDDLSREMEDMFLRGIKALLTRYLEKQLEIPLKEAVMTSIGYTVSYG